MVLLSGLTTIHEAPAVFWGPSRQRVIHKLELIKMKKISMKQPTKSSSDDSPYYHASINIKITRVAEEATRRRAVQKPFERVRSGVAEVILRPNTAGDC